MDFDLIKEQILIAAGTPISGQLYFPEKMHAIECRVNAEDPLNNFAPSPGKISALHTPKGYGVRVDTHVYSGYTVPPFYDSMIAKVICRAKSRQECIVKMERALNEFIIEGVKTTIPFHLALLKNQDFIDGNYDTGLLDRFDYVSAIKELKIE
jgi:acetyl-CoA carboxylase biotin carboxylase subunit